MSVPAAEDIQQETLLVHAGAPSLVDGAGPVNTPVIRTSTVRFRDTATQTAYQQLRAQGEPVATYGRHGLETHRALEQAVSSLEGGYRSFLTPSGLSAITLVLLSLLSPGDHVLVSDSVYSPIRRVDKTLLKRLGIDVEYFSVSDSTLSQKFKPNTRLLYVESPSSLLYEVLDLPELAALARARGVLVATDNTWSGGFFYKPLTLGANISIQASTKYIGGHSDLMQGIVTVDTPELFALIAPTYEALGLTVGADDAYLALRGLRTLSVRLRSIQAYPGFFILHWSQIQGTGYGSEIFQVRVD
jgi:cystathionine beta-lyase